MPSLSTRNKAHRPSFLVTSLPLLLPLFVRAMPTAWNSPQPAPLLRRQLEYPVAADTVAADSQPVATSSSTAVTSMLAPGLPLAVPAPSPEPIAANPAANDGSRPILVFPHDSPLQLPGGSPSSAPTSVSPTAPTNAPGANAGASVPAPPVNPDAAPDSSSASAPDSGSGSGSGSDTGAAVPGPAPPSTTPLVMAYYPDWVADEYPPEKVDFGRFDWIDYAFAVPDDNRALSWDGDDDAADVLRRLVDRAHAAGKRVKLSVGGWSGSKYFSSAVTDAQGRATLADNVLALYTAHNLDGIDIDWEFPSQAGAAGNGARPDDAAHFLEFLRTLRGALPPNATLTAATQTVPFADADGRPMRDVSGFASVLDWVLIMNYDTWGSSSKPGPNAPLSNACQNSTQSRSNALSALQAWTSAGFAPSQVVLGVPSYGYISRSSELLLQDRRRRKRRRNLDWAAVADAAEPVADILPGVLLVKNEDGGTEDGQVQFRELVRQGVVQAYGDPDPSNSTSTNTNPIDGVIGAGGRLFAGAGGFVRMWDACSSTPYLRSADARQVVAYDDPASLAMKAELVRGAGMRGVNMFDVHGDTDEWDLTDALRRGLGLL